MAKIASKGKRIINLLVDSCCIILLSSIVFYLMSVVILNSSVAEKFSNQQKIISLDYFVVIIAFSYYLFFEGLSYRTIGKYITKTRVVRPDGGTPSFMQIIARTLLRIVPFDFITYLVVENGWHDRFSNTIVIEQ